MDYNDYLAGISSEHFWFKAKRNLIETLLAKVNNQSHATNILNIGAGTGEDLNTIKNFGSIYAIDVSQNTLDMIPAHLVKEKKCMDACNLDYGDNFFDIVVAFDVLEHIQHDQQAIAEIYRTLKPGGFLIFTVPAFNFLYSEHDRVLHHHRRYNKTMLKKLCSPFNKITLGYWNSILFPASVLHRLLQKNQKTYRPVITAPSKLNSLFYNILMFENWCVKHNIPLSYGLSLFGIYKK